jgi:O-antigen chain-terminating methyltransferase
MSPGAAPDESPPQTREVDLERQVTSLSRTVDELGRLARDTLDRLQSVETELRSLRADGGGSQDVDGWGPRFAAIYADFTDHFRGSTAEIGAKLAGYLPDVHRVAGPGGVVDLGSGRGEWLALLGAAGVAARGVDANPAFVAAGRARGLDMELGDALGYLQALPPDSLDMVTAFHVIEHLGTEDLLALLEAANGALRPGGCLLLETPNPTNLVMGACDFYNDPTHRSPLPPALTEYLVSTQGFGDIEVRPLHPKTSPLAPTGDRSTDAQLRELVTQTFFGPQDYAVLGYKLPAEER